MRHEGPRSLIRTGRWTSATVALVVCTVGTAITLVVGRRSAILLLASVAVALGGYWWMVTAEARRPTLTLRAVVVAVAVVIGVAVTTVPRQSGDPGPTPCTAGSSPSTTPARTGTFPTSIRTT